MPDLVDVIQPLPALAGAALGALLIRERRRRRRAERFSAAAMESLLRAIDANDPETGAHVRRVADYSLAIAYALGVDEGSQRTIELTALFHDVGKIHEALFDIVHEHQKLTPAMRRAIHRHPLLGSVVLGPIANFHPQLAEAVLSHHEHWNGRGYPRGLKGRKIPLAARVVALADTFDAITHSRRYRGGRGAREAERIILEGRGTQFDPELVDLMLLPPVFDRILRAQRDFTTHNRPLPRRRARRGVAVKSQPQIKIRWRTRSAPPKAVHEKSAKAR